MHVHSPVEKRYRTRISYRKSIVFRVVCGDTSKSELVLDIVNSATYIFINLRSALPKYKSSHSNEYEDPSSSITRYPYPAYPFPVYP